MDALYPGNVPEDAKGRELWEVWRIVDKRTGQPIAGARLSLTDETVFPIGEMPYRPLAEGRSGPDGWVRVKRPAEGRGEWKYVEAEGYGPRGDMVLADRAVELAPAVDVPFLVLDRWDRPVPHPVVDWHLGCGHTPAVQVVRGDAQGRVTLRGIDPRHGEAWIYAPGVEGDYLDIPLREPGDPPVIVRHGFSRPHEGQVVDEQGRPVAGAYVGMRNSHRGPWARTGPDGRFRLIGLGHDELMLGRDRNRKDPDTGYDAAPPGFPGIYRLPPDGTVDWDLNDREGTAVSIAVTGPDGAPLEGAALQAIDVRDGWSTWTTAEGPGAVAQFSLPAGEYVVRFFDDQRARWARDPVRITVGAGPLTRTMQARENGRCVITLDGPPPDAVVTLLTREGERLVRMAEDEPAGGALPPVFVEDGVESWVRVQAAGTVTVDPVPPTAPGRTTGVTVRWPAPKEVRLRVVDAAGAPANATVRLRCADGAEGRGRGEQVTVRTWGRGSTIALIYSEPRAYQHVARRVFELPDDPGAVVDLGTITLPPAPSDPPPARDCTILVEVRTSDGGAPWQVGVSLDGTFDVQEGLNPAGYRLTTTAGAHELVVAAPGYLARVHRLELEPGETRGVTVTLTRK